MDDIVRFAGEHLGSRNLAHGQVSRQTVPRPHRDTNIPVRDNANQFALIPHDGKHTDISLPHQLYRSTHICPRSAANYGLRHNFFYFHRSSPLTLSALQTRKGRAPAGRHTHRKLERILLQQPVVPAMASLNNVSSRMPTTSSFTHLCANGRQDSSPAVQRPF